MTSNQLPLLQCIQKILETIDLESQYQIVPQYYEVTKDEFEKSIEEFNKKLETYYLKISDIIDVDKAFAKRNNYFLFDGFSADIEAKKFKKLTPKELLSMVYSPQSINFWQHTFYDVLNPIFTKEVKVIDYDEIINAIQVPITNSIIANLKYCPKYLRIILTQGINQISPIEFYQKYILEEMFTNPHLFNILKFNQDSKLTPEELTSLKDQLISSLNQFHIHEIIQDQPNILDSLQSYGKSTYDSKQYYCLRDLQELLKLRSNIDLDVSAPITEKNFYGELEKIFVEEDNKLQNHYFKGLKNAIKSQDKIKDKDLIEKFTNKANLLYNEHLLQYYTLMTNDTIFQADAFSYVKGHKNLHRHTVKEYIDNPSLFMTDLIAMTLPKNAAGRFISLFRRKDINTDAAQSGIFASPDNPIFCSMFLDAGMTFKDFIQRRPALRMADSTFMNIVECTPIDYEETIFKLYKEKAEEFQEIATLFVSAFRKNVDPYEKARTISKTYEFIVQKMTDLTGFEIESKEHEAKFLCSLFRLAKPPFIISTYIYLYEYLIAPSYSQIYINKNDDGNPFKRLEMTSNILNPLIKYYKFDVSEHCRINRTSCNLDVKNANTLKSFLKDIIEENQEENIFIENSEMLLKKLESIENGSEFTFRIIQIASNQDNEDGQEGNEDDDKVDDSLISYSDKTKLKWICNVKIDQGIKKEYAFPDDMLEFVEQLGKKADRD